MVVLSDSPCCSPRMDHVNQSEVIHQQDQDQQIQGPLAEVLLWMLSLKCRIRESRKGQKGVTQQNPHAKKIVIQSKCSLGHESPDLLLVTSPKNMGLW